MDIWLKGASKQCARCNQDWGKANTSTALHVDVVIRRNLESIVFSAKPGMDVRSSLRNWKPIVLATRKHGKRKEEEKKMRASNLGGCQVRAGGVGFFRRCFSPRIIRVKQINR